MSLITSCFVPRVSFSLYSIEGLVFPGTLMSGKRWAFSVVVVYDGKLSLNVTVTSGRERRSRGPRSFMEVGRERQVCDMNNPVPPRSICLPGM